MRSVVIGAMATPTTQPQAPAQGRSGILGGDVNILRKTRSRSEMSPCSSLALSLLSSAMALCRCVIRGPPSTNLLAGDLAAPASQGTLPRRGERSFFHGNDFGLGGLRGLATEAAMLHSRESPSPRSPLKSARQISTAILDQYVCSKPPLEENNTFQKPPALGS